MPNRLIHSTSPYLLQHAHNPVDWYEWGSEALDRARMEDKPILVSIGYSSCHWCHVMEHESFENEDIAQIMNEHFICIKVDREERPDVDHIYMEAVQAMGQNGGWPLNVFLTPRQQPFYGGTYFPPRNWAQLLLQIHKAFGDQREKIESSANDLTQHLQVNDSNRFVNPEHSSLRKESLDSIFSVLKSRFDTVHGGMDKAPKFVMPTIWQFLLRYYHITGNKEALQMVTFTLEKMGRGGIYDQAAGGFARYSVDSRWFAPHFEKMLYDNAQLVSLYAEAFQATQNPYFQEIVRETVSWLENEMLHPEGGFYSALDADSEGMEGKFYTWTWAEWQVALGVEAESAAAYFGVTPDGNWEHGRSILITHENPTATNEKVLHWKTLMRQAREDRVRPGLDDKILAGWNTMLIKGLLDAAAAFQNEHYLDLAIRGIHFIEKHMITESRLSRSFKGKSSATEGFLEDYAYLIQCYVHLYQTTFDETWLHKASDWMNYTVDHFHDPEDGFFHYASDQSEKLIARKKEIFDNVIPSSNSLMARNLFQLGTLLDHEAWKELAHEMVGSLAELIEKEPGYLSHWGIAMAEIIHGLHEVAIVGKQAQGIKQEFSQRHLPFSLWLGATEHSDLPLLTDKVPVAGGTTIFVCKNKVCQLPVQTVEEALRQLR